MIDDKNFDLLTTDEYLQYACDKIIILNQHIDKLWKNKLIHPKLSLNAKIKFRNFYNEANYIVTDVLFLEKTPNIVDEDALDNIIKEVQQLMKQARSIVDDIRTILDKD